MCKTGQNQYSDKKAYAKAENKKKLSKKGKNFETLLFRLPSI